MRRSPLDGVNDETRLNNMTSILLHEIAHLYFAPDHYHAVNGDEECTNKDICSECGNNKRPSSCIMYNSYATINYNNLDNVFCSGCFNDMADILNSLDGPSM